MPISVGERIPAMPLKAGSDEGPKDIDTGALFKGRKVVLFSVPGAFTPTCSAKHLPGFVEKYDQLKEKGVDEVVCLAVNDAFVMTAWGRMNECMSKITMLADGNADFTKALGLEMDASKNVMGTRGQRFALVAEDGVVTHLFVEEPGQFNVSSADNVLAHL